jgi:hypothetical protein
MPMELWRQIHCPICGAELRVEVANGGQFPEVHVLPPHTPAKARVRGEHDEPPERVVYEVLQHSGQ